ncbi:hypothetical protein Dimus_020812, partial [Dionaea muscipula]
VQLSSFTPTASTMKKPTAANMQAITEVSSNSSPIRSSPSQRSSAAPSSPKFSLHDQASTDPSLGPFSSSYLSPTIQHAATLIIHDECEQTMYQRMSDLIQATTSCPSTTHFAAHICAAQVTAA